jgi:hypothetical protein
MHIKLLSARQKNRDKKCSWSKLELYMVYGYNTISFLPNNNKTGNDKMKFSLWLHTMKESILVNGNIIYIALKNYNNFAFFSSWTFHGYCHTVIYNSNIDLYIDFCFIVIDLWDHVLLDDTLHLNIRIHPLDN